MRIPNTIVAAFVGDGLDGNLAGVCPVHEWPAADAMQSVATFNGLPETAFVRLAPDCSVLRWFTPTTEVRMCGHATLATAFVLRHRLGWQDTVFTFATMFGDRLSAIAGNELITLDFPAHDIAPSDASAVGRILGLAPDQALLGESWVLVLEDEAAVRAYDPDFEAISALPQDGVIITAPGDHCDFVSRYFAPQAGIPEDPVTGYAHTLLVPYWARRLGKNELHALQVSRAGGELFCEMAGDRVLMSGRARLVSEGEVTVEGTSVSATTV